LSPGELQRLRLGTQVRSNLFGVVYVLDEPSAGLHPSDTEALLRALAKLKAAGNSLFVVEHELDVVREADWIVDVGPDAGGHGGEILYNGPIDGLKAIERSYTARYLFGAASPSKRVQQSPQGWLRLRGVTRNNLRNLDVDVPLEVLTAVTGVSGSGKSSLVSQFLVEALAGHFGHSAAPDEESEGRLALRRRLSLGIRVRRVVAQQVVLDQDGAGIDAKAINTSVKPEVTWAIAARTSGFRQFRSGCSTRKE
jgi:excinuclease ABC subunit A